MEANPDKFQVMLLSKKEMKEPFSFTLNGNILKSDTCVKLLGTDQICQKSSTQLEYSLRDSQNFG